MPTWPGEWSSRRCRRRRRGLRAGRRPDWEPPCRPWPAPGWCGAGRCRDRRRRAGRGRSSRSRWWGWSRPTGRGCRGTARRRATASPGAAPGRRRARRPRAGVVAVPCPTSPKWRSERIEDGVELRCGSVVGLRRHILEGPALGTESTRASRTRSHGRRPRRHLSRPMTIDMSRTVLVITAMVAGSVSAIASTPGRAVMSSSSFTSARRRRRRARPADVRRDAPARRPAVPPRTRRRVGRQRPRPRPRPVGGAPGSAWPRPARSGAVLRKRSRSPRDGAPPGPVRPPVVAAGQRLGAAGWPAPAPGGRAPSWARRTRRTLPGGSGSASRHGLDRLVGRQQAGQLLPTTRRPG